MRSDDSDVGVIVNETECEPWALHIGYSVCFECSSNGTADVDSEYQCISVLVI